MMISSLGHHIVFVFIVIIVIIIIIVMIIIINHNHHHHHLHTHDYHRRNNDNNTTIITFNTIIIPLIITRSNISANASSSIILRCSRKVLLRQHTGCVRRVTIDM